MPSENRPLVVGTDETVLDEILRLAAVVGCEPDVVTDLGAARRRWADAPLVLTGDEDVGDSAGLPRREGVLLVRKGPPVADSWRHAYTVGAENIVVLPDDEQALLGALADAVDVPNARRGHVVGVVGGRGGAGASVLAASVAVQAARSGGHALLVDCDPLGGGIELVLGTDGDDGLRWPDLRLHAGRVAMSALDDALPSQAHADGLLSVLSCDRLGPGPEGEAVAAVVDAGTRAGRVVVCDLPRPRDVCVDAVLARADLVAVLVPADVRACVGAARVLASFGDHADKARVLVRGPAQTGLTGADVVEAVGAPSLGWLRPERGVARAIDRGVFDPRRGSSLGAASRAVLDAIGVDRAAGAAEASDEAELR